MKTYYDNNDPALCLKPLSVEMVAKSNNDGKKISVGSYTCEIPKCEYRFVTGDKMALDEYFE